jgi:large subunit ribosomal protein L21
MAQEEHGMYAIVGVAGFQFKMAKDAVVRVPRRSDWEAGQKVVLDNVLMISDGGEALVGRPTVSGASVEVEVLKHGRTRKQLAAVFKKRKDYRRRWGFRAEFTEVRVGTITRG